MRWATWRLTITKMGALRHKSVRRATRRGIPPNGDGWNPNLQSRPRAGRLEFEKYEDLSEVGAWWALSYRGCRDRGEPHEHRKAATAKRCRRIGKDGAQLLRAALRSCSYGAGATLEVAG